MELLTDKLAAISIESSRVIQSCIDEENIDYTKVNMEKIDKIHNEMCQLMLITSHKDRLKILGRYLQDIANII